MTSGDVGDGGTAVAVIAAELAWAVILIPSNLLLCKWQNYRTTVSNRIRRSARNNNRSRRHSLVPVNSSSL